MKCYSDLREYSKDFKKDPSYWKKHRMTYWNSLQHTKNLYLQNHQLTLESYEQLWQEYFKTEAGK